MARQFPRPKRSGIEIRRLVHSQREFRSQVSFLHHSTRPSRRSGLAHGRPSSEKEPPYVARLHGEWCPEQAQRVEGQLWVQMCYHVHILRRSEGSYYAGHTDDLKWRTRRHNEGRGPGYRLSPNTGCHLWEKGGDSGPAKGHPHAHPGCAPGTLPTAEGPTPE